MTGESLPLAIETRLLLTRSSAWLADAMDAWSDEATHKVTALAPIAVELAVKAMLWQTSPTLLVPLDRQHELSMVQLATSPQLSSEKLRTVGLTEALSRAISVASKELNLDPRRRKRMADCRNGAMHVGTADAALSRHVLTDCLEVLVWILDHLGFPEKNYFGDHLTDCRALLDQSRSEIHDAVLAKLSKHRKQHERLVQSLGEKVAKGAFEALELSAMAAYAQSDRTMGAIIPEGHERPACKRRGALYGVVSLDSDVSGEWDDGQMNYFADWLVLLTPILFTCKVCGLTLRDSQQLELAGLPSTLYLPKRENLGDFDLDAYLADYLRIVDPHDDREDGY